MNRPSTLLSPQHWLPLWKWVLSLSLTLSQYSDLTDSPAPGPRNRKIWRQVVSAIPAPISCSASALEREATSGYGQGREMPSLQQQWLPLSVSPVSRHGSSPSPTASLTDLYIRTFPKQCPLWEGWWGPRTVTSFNKCQCWQLNTVLQTPAPTAPWGCWVELEGLRSK
jgi:hypothetical protein